MLAFLSGIKDDPSKVTAVCVHETDEGEALSVMVAANSRGWVLLSPYLDSIKRGLDELFLILANASRGMSSPSKVSDGQGLMRRQFIAVSWRNK